MKLVLKIAAGIVVGFFVVICLSAMAMLWGARSLGNDLNARFDQIAKQAEIGTEAAAVEATEVEPRRETVAMPMMAPRREVLSTLVAPADDEALYRRTLKVQAALRAFGFTEMPINGVTDRTTRSALRSQSA